MKANELRIGNIVWDDYSGQMIVSAIDASKTTFMGVKTVSLRKDEKMPSGLYAVGKIKPIALTDDWLSKLGFELINKVNVLYHKNVADSIGWHIELRLINVGNNPTWSVTYSSMHNQISIPLKIKYVHELQNLYFALTGNDLQLHL